MNEVVQWHTIGREAGLNSDINPKDLPDANLYLTTPETGALNIRSIGAGTNVTPDYELIIGNEYVYEPIPVAVQNKRFRVYLEAKYFDSKEWSYIALFSPSFQIANSGYLANQNSSALDFYNLFIVAINDPVNGWKGQQFSYGSFVSTSATTGYFDIEITTVPGWDYSIVVSDNATGGKPPIVLQEAIDLSMVGIWHEIGNNDQMGDLFHFWTTRTDERILNVQNAFQNPSLGIRIETSVPHGFTSNDDGRAVFIENITGTTEANGIWIIKIYDATHFDLLGSVWKNTYIGGGTVNLNPYGLGEIGVAVKDEDTQVWTYNGLLRSKEFNWITSKQIDCRFKRKNDGNIAGYFVEQRNNPRVFYYKGAYKDDGALTINGGQYEYGNISSELRWIIAQGGGSGFGIDVDAAAQIQSNGALFAGNWRYAANFLTDKKSESGWTPLTNPVPVYFSSTNGAADQIWGNQSGYQTSKQNVLKVHTPVVGLFKYVKIAAINYEQNGAYTGVVLDTYLLTNTATTTIIHTGNETNKTDLDIGTLNSIQTNIDTARNVEISDNRAILSNLTVKKVYDLTSFAKTIKHSVLRKTLLSVGNKHIGIYVKNEYLDPENVCNYTGYMMNETYRFGAKFKKNGAYISDVVYHVDDIKIDSNTVNTAYGADPTRRVKGLQDASGKPSMDLTNANATEVYVPYIEFSDINLNFIVDGKAVRDIFDEIEWYRVEMTDLNREVIGDGVLVAAIRFKQNSTAPQGGDWPQTISGYLGATIDVQYSNAFKKTIKKYIQFFASPEGVNKLNGGTASFGKNRQDLTDYVFACGLSYHSGTGNLPYNNLSLTSTGSYNMEIMRNYASFYSQDLLLTGTNYTKQAGDQVLLYGAPNRTYVTNIGGRNGFEEGALQNNYSEFSGYANLQKSNYPYNFNVISIDDAITVPRDGRVQFSSVANSVYYSKSPYIILVDTDSAGGQPTQSGWEINKDIPGSPVIYSNTAFNSLTSFVDMGVYRSQIYRAKNDKFGQLATTKYVYTGSYYKTTPSQNIIGTGVISVFGGDTFTQKSYLKHIRTQDFHHDTNAGKGAAWQLAGFEQGMAYYSQNRVNSQMTDIGGNTDSGKYPSIGTNEWLNVNGYWISTNSRIFNETPPITTNYNSGYNIRNQLLQQAAFDPNAEYQTDWGNAFIWSDSEGDGTVTDQLRYFPPLNLKFQDYTNGAITDLKELNGEIIIIQPSFIERQYYNTTNVVTSTEGSEVILGQSSVFARKGTISSRFGCQNKWSIIIGMSDKGMQNLYFWDLKNKAIGRIGYDGTNALDEIHGIKSFVANNTRFVMGKDTPAHREGITGVANQKYREAIWTVAGFSPNNPNNYNHYTIVWSELKNVFQAFHSYKPKRYAKYNNTFLSIEGGKAYEHDRGQRGVWYGGALQSDGFFDAVINTPKDVVKYFEATDYNSDSPPSRVDYSTPNGVSYLNGNEFITREGLHRSPVKNESTATVFNPFGLNSARTSRMWGEYMVVRTWLSRATYNKINSFIMKVRYSSRLFKK